MSLLPAKLSRYAAIAALIPAAALIRPIDTPARLFGYPALAMLMLLSAGSGAAYLALQIVRHDKTPKAR